MVILSEESLKWLKWRNMTVSNNVVGMPKSLVIPLVFSVMWKSEHISSSMTKQHKYKKQLENIPKHTRDSNFKK